MNMANIYTDLNAWRRQWMTYGLTMSKAMLSTSAHTLRSTAAFLDTLTKRMEEETKPMEPAEPVGEQ